MATHVIMVSLLANDILVNWSRICLSLWTRPLLVLGLILLVALPLVGFRAAVAVLTSVLCSLLAFHDVSLELGLELVLWFEVGSTWLNICIFALSLG
jgi:hypothetical protein